MLRDEIILAVNNLFKRKLRSWLTILGVVIGIAAVVALIGLGEGLTRFVTAQFGIVGADTITIRAEGDAFAPPGTGVVNPLTESQLKRIRNVKGVQTAIGRIIETASVEFNDKTKVNLIVSVPSGDERDDLYDILNLDVTSGRLLKDNDQNNVLIGSELTDKELWNKPLVTGRTILIKGREFTVVGVLKKKGSFVTDTTIWMNEEPMRDLFEDTTKNYDVIAARASPGENIDIIVERIKKELRKARDVKEGEEDFTVQTAQSAIESLQDTLFAIQLFVYIIAAVSLLVGGIGISNTMYTAVLERITEIGTMKAIGARNKDIFTIFAIEAGLIGLVGGLIGMSIGVAMSHGLAYAGRLALDLNLIQAHTSAGLILGSLAFSFIVGLLAGLLPAYQAATMHPVEALNTAK